LFQSKRKKSCKRYVNGLRRCGRRVGVLVRSLIGLV
jgi:hypothetical protein